MHHMFRIFTFSGMLCCVDLLIDTDFSKNREEFTFRFIYFKDRCNTS
jgi:hypothetical protein